MPNPTKPPASKDAEKPPVELLDDIDEAENDRVAAEEASEVADEDEAAAEDGMAGRIPTGPVP